MAPKDYVYIVDDDKAAGNYLAILLTSAGFRTKRFSSGHEFLHEAPSLEPGCLVSDVRMPEMDNDHEGVELAKIVAQRLNSLTAREREVLERLFAGQPNKTMARELAISPRTVEFHRSHVMAKMQARSISELVRLALLAGLKIDP